MSDKRKRAEIMFSNHLLATFGTVVIDQEKLKVIVDAMLAFADEEVAKARKEAIADCVAMCYSKGEINAAEAIERGVP